MTRTLTELLKDFRYSIERALAGHMTGKDDKNLSDEDVKAAGVETKKIDLHDYVVLADALDNKELEVTIDDEAPEDALHRIMKKYGIKHVKESDYVDRDIMAAEGFQYYVIVDDDKLRNKVTRFLDEEEIEFMDDNSGHLQMKFNDRDVAYKVESAIAKMIRRSNPQFMRDSVVEGKKKSKKPSTIRSPIATTKQTGAGFHSPAKYAKADRIKGKKQAEQGVNNE